MRKIFFNSLLTTFLFFVSYQAFSQNQLVLDSTLTPGNYSARFSVVANPGTKAVPASGQYMHLFIDNTCHVTISTSANTICLGASDTLTAHGSSTSTYLWSNGATTSQIVVTPTVTTIYSVTCTNPTRCVSNASCTIDVPGSGGGCSCATVLPHVDTINYHDSMPAHSVRWYSFIASGTKEEFFINPDSYSFGHVHYLKIYDSCGGDLIFEDSTSGFVPFLLDIDTNMVLGKSYVLELLDNNNNCTVCNSSVSYTLSITVINSVSGTCPQSWTTIYNGSGCGLNYAFSSISLHGRTNITAPHCSSPDMSSVPMNANWGVFNISRIPTGSTPIKGYLIYSVIDPSDINNPPSPFPFTNNHGTTYTLTPTQLGQEQSWSPFTQQCVNQIATCWIPDNTTNWGYYGAGAYSNYVEIPGSDIYGDGNGNYTLVHPSTTLPYYPNTPHSDIDGATLIIIYKDVNPNYSGFLQINGGMNFDDPTGPPAPVTTWNLPLSPAMPSATANQRAFFIADDFENCQTDASAIGTNGYRFFGPPSTPATMYNAQLWNTIQQNTTYGATSNMNYYITEGKNKDGSYGGDCYDMVALGAYWQIPANITISASNTQMICPGGSVTLTATAGMTSYLWSTGETTSSITVSPQSTTVYTVNGTTSASCQTVTASYTVNVLDMLIVGPDAACDGKCTDCFITESPMTTGFYTLTYSVTATNCPGNITYTHFTETPYASPIVSPTGWYGNPYQIYVEFGSDAAKYGFDICCDVKCTESSNGHVIECTVCKHVDGCCPENQRTDNCVLIDPDLNTISTVDSKINSKFTHIIDSAGSWYIEDIADAAINFSPPVGDCPSLTIDGTFMVEHNLTIKNCVIEMGPDAKIELINGAQLTIENSHLYPCSNMWDGIYIPNRSKLYVKDGSVIEGAKNAIVAEFHGEYHVTGSTLNGNYKGIQLQPGASAASTITGSQILCNYITAGQPYPPDNNKVNPVFGGGNATLLAPYTNYQSEIGIYDNNGSNLTIGDVSVSPYSNLFENQYYCIYTRASNVNIYNNNFTNAPCGGCSNPSNPYGSAGILSAGDPSATYTATVGGTGTNQPNIFHSCNTSIIIMDTLNSNIQKNQMWGGKIGIWLNRNMESRSGMRTRNYVLNNDVYYQSIGIQATNNLNTRLTQINNNQVLASAWGITLTEGTPSSSTIYNVESNVIWTPTYGIGAYQIHNSIIGTNTVTISANPASEGLAMNAEVTCDIGSNIVNGSGAGEGYRFFDCHGPNNYITCNQANTTNIGMTFWDNQLGDYIDYNQMTGFNQYGLLIGNSTTYIGSQVSNLWATNNTWSPFNNNAKPATYSYFPLNTNIFYVNPAPPSTYNPISNKANVGDVPVNFTQTTNLDQGPSCSSTCAGCGIANSLLPSGSKSDMKHLAYQIIGDSNNFQGLDSIPGHWREKFQLYSDIIDGDSAFIPATGTAPDSIIQKFKDSIIHSNLGRIYRLINVLADTNGLTDDDIVNANALLNSISSPNDIENTYSQFYQIYLTMVETGTGIPDSSEMVTLKNIANLCPEYYGGGVFSARAMLAQFDTIMYMSDCEMIPDTNRGHRAIKHTNSSNPQPLVSVYPNPANTVLNVQIIPENPNQTSQYFYYLYDNLGQLVQKDILTNNFTVISLANVSEGIYYYRIVDDKQKVLKSDKLQIIR